MQSDKASRLLIGCLVIVLLTVGSVPVLNWVAYSPGRSVSAYLQEISRADVGAALGLLDAEIPPLPADLLTNAPSLPTHIHIEDENVDGLTASVTASYVLGDSTHTSEFTLKQHKPLWGLFNRWRIEAEDLPTLNLGENPVAGLKVNGVNLIHPESKMRMLFPASYAVGLDTKYFTSDPQRFELTAARDTHELNLEATPNSTLTQAVNEAATEHLNKCAEQPVLMPTGCSFGHSTDNEILGEVTWEIKQIPEISLVMQENSVKLEPKTLQAIVSGRSRDIVTAYESDFNATVDFTFSANVEFVDEQPVIVAVQPATD